MLAAELIKEWIDGLDKDAFVFIDEGGLILRTVDNEAYLEVGGMDEGADEPAVPANPDPLIPIHSIVASLEGARIDVYHHVASRSIFNHKDNSWHNEFTMPIDEALKNWRAFIAGVNNDDADRIVHAIREVANGKA